MKQRTNYLLIAILLCLVFIAAPIVRAQSNAGDSNDNTTSSADDSYSESEDNPTDKRSAQERMEAQKKEQKEKLTESQQANIRATCKTAEAALSSLHTRINESVTTRTKAY